jgi:N-methylhydantoinase A
VIREYQRISTTVLDAFVGPVVASYLEALENDLQEAGLRTPQMYIMQSNGGLMRIDVASRYPNQTLLSGPAAGVVFGAYLGEVTGGTDVITFDMGGTSTDISVLPSGTYSETREGRISGQDIGTPMIHIRTLGAGGGSLAWIGPDGLLKVGPRSAGADPGPACYGRGGIEPTVTDAHVVLGYLRPEGLAGGKLRLDPDRAAAAIDERIARPLGLSVLEAALGIVQVVNVEMEVGLRLSLVELGLDPRQFSLVAFGGCGPLHAVSVAASVGIPRVIVPPAPGLSCAMGLLQTDVKHYYLQSRLAPISALPPAELASIFESLEERARQEAVAESLDLEHLRLVRQLDMRYPHQGYELTVPLPSEAIGRQMLEEARTAFDRLHERVYGVSAGDEEPEVVNARVACISALPHLDLPPVPAGSSAGGGPRERREALLDRAAGPLKADVYDRAMLGAGVRLKGPAVVEQMDSTTLIPPGWRAEMDGRGNLILERT